MFSIALKENQYPTYILSDREAESRLEVIPERGGLITQWQIQDVPILYFDAERFQDPSLSVRGGIPILFPICGNLPDNTYRLEGQAYTLKQHGFARDMPWQVSDRGVKSGSEGGAMLQLTLESTPETLTVYPFDFRLDFTYRLQGNRLILDQRYTNRSERPMPFSCGFHPYFQVSATAKSGLLLDLPATEYVNHLDLSEAPFNGSLDWSAPEIDIALRPLSAQIASVADSQRGIKLFLSYDPEFTTLVFWSTEGKDYYCLEPWSAPRNALNTGNDLITLPPGETKSLQVILEAQLLSR